MKPLDPVKIPLRGLHLIEASAGTGKTYTIATLCLRLLLEGLPVDRILVVTYTNAATEELRGRFRRRVAEALAFLEAGQASAEPEPELTMLLDAVKDPDGARILLTEAVTRMDEAAVYTIHGFCQRALQENAFESGSPFESEMLTEEDTLRRQVSEDFWRRRVATSDVEEAAWVREHWTGPAEILTAISDGIARDELRLLPASAAEELKAASRQSCVLFERMGQLWSTGRQDVVGLLETSRSLNRNSFRKQIVARAVKQMDDLMEHPRPTPRLPRDFERFTPKELTAKTKPGHTPPTHPFFELCGDLAELTERISALRRAAFLTEARGYIRGELAKRKEAARQLFYDDLLNRLDAALTPPDGERLGERLRERFPVALIDEFQDTDPVQYRIFRRLYAARPECGLYLIGDPKQAIYAFRGADIFTYIRARRDVAGEGAEHTLGTNWRSASRLVKAVNGLFARSSAPFVYRDDIPFHPVAPGPKADEEPLRISGQQPAPLHFWLLPPIDQDQTRNGRISKDSAARTAAQACAGRIAELLHLSGAGEVTLGERPLAARDIAVLVRTHREGAIVQRALRRVGVASVTLSQDSVFETEESRELSLMLEAIADGADESLIRGAAATMLLGVPLSQLAALSSDEQLWEDLVQRFQGYRERWRSRGFMNAFQAMLHGEGVPARLLACPDGERRLTNLLQLAELLQIAEGDHPGLDGLLRWLSDRRGDPPKGDESAQLRLESDEALVAVVTMHRSKGLEYPVVFLPFPWSGSMVKKGSVLFHDPEDLAAYLDVGSPDLDRHREIAAREELAQRLRLLYVAVTRAKHLCHLCWGPIKDAEGSALAWLLHPDTAGDPPASRMAALGPEDLRADLLALSRETDGNVLVEDLPTTTAGQWRDAAASSESLAAETSTGEIPRDWRITSYSWLASGAESERPDYDPMPPEAAADIQPATADLDGIFRFPRGVQAGHFLHALLEHLDFTSAEGDGLTATSAGLLERYGLDPSWAAVVSRSIQWVLDSPLDHAGGLRLRDLGTEHRLNELEFHFSVERLEPLALKRCLESFAGYGSAAEGLTFEAVRGLMKGYIDLVFRADGRFYLVDYKSNHLGDRLEDYGDSGLRRAMRGHRYELQYLVYTLALHRYLHRRLPGYAYERHFGGVYYLFLRGMRPEQAPRYGVYNDRPPLALVEALDRLFAGEALASEAAPVRGTS